MKMFLSSTIDRTIDLLIGKTDKRKVLFINNPVDPFKNKYWMRKERKSFIENGFEVYDCDIRKDRTEIINQFEILHICGGSALYILRLLRETGWFEAIWAAIKCERIIYTGTSAGSMIMAPSIWFAHDDEDEKEARMVANQKDCFSFGFCPFYLMCHAQDKYYIKSTKKSMNRLPKNKIPILFLNDNMALWIEDEKIEFIKN